MKYMTTEIDTRQTVLKKGSTKSVEILGGRLALRKMEADIVAEKTEDRKKLAALSIQGVITKEFENALISFKERYYRFVTSELKQTKAALPDIVHALEMAIHDAQETLHNSSQDALLLLREEQNPPPTMEDAENLVLLHEFRVRKHGMEHLMVLYTRTPSEVTNADIFPCSIEDLLDWVNYDFQEVNTILRRVVRQQEELDRANKPRLDYV